MVVSIGGDSDLGKMCLATIKPELVDQKTKADEWANYLKDACVTIQYGLAQKGIRDRVILLQSGGVSSDHTIQLFQIVATPESVQFGRVNIDPNCPVSILPPKDIPYNDCLSIFHSITHRLYPHKSHLTHEEWTNVARNLVEAVSLQSQYVDNIPQELTVYLEDDDI